MRSRGTRPGRLVSTPPLSWEQYAARWASLHGGIDPRRARPSVRRWFHTGYAIARVASRLSIRPGAVTAIGLLACVFVPVFAIRGTGLPLVAASLVAAAAIADTVDGALAVLTSRTTRMGYVYDAVADRLGEVCWLLALWRLGAPVSVTVAAGALTWLHEYARSRANAAGMTEISAVTLGERPTRVFVSVIGLGLAGVIGLGSADLARGTSTFAVFTWLVLAVIGFAQLFASVHRALAGRDWPMWTPPPMAQIVPVSAPPAAPVGGYDGFGEVYPPDPELDEVAATMSATTTIYASESVMHSGPIGLNAVGFDGEIAPDDLVTAPDEAPGRHTAADEAANQIADQAAGS